MHRPPEAVLTKSAAAEATLRPHRSGAARLAAWAGGRALGSKAVFSIADQATLSLTNFATSVLIGRACGKAELGSYALALSVVLLARGIQEQLVAAPYMIYCHRRKGEELLAYTGSTLVHHLLLAVVAMLAVAGFGAWLAVDGQRAEMLWVVSALLGAMPLVLLRDYIRGLCLARLELPALLGLDAAVACIQIGGLLLLVWQQALSVAAVYAVMGMACALASLGWFLGAKARFRIRRAEVLSDWWSNWSFARWALVSHLVGCCTPVIIPWLVTWCCGRSATGMFAASMTLVGFAGVLVAGLTNLAVPRASRAFARGGAAELKRATLEMAVTVSVPSAAFFVIALVAGDWAAVLIYGSQFQGTGPVLAAMALWLFCNSLGIAAGSALWAMERPAANLVADVAVIGITLAAVPALAYPFGILGAAWGMLAGAVAGMLLRWITVAHCLTRPSPELAAGPRQAGNEPVGQWTSG
jgi:O-antigen/teichoic acid export membrane protein